MQPKDDSKLEMWAVLELFGHTKIAGFVRQIALGGDVLLRVDVPEVTFTRRTYVSYDQPAKEESATIAPFTKFYSPKAVFALTPVDEETARRMMADLAVEPIQAFRPRIAAALPAPPETSDEDEDRHDEDDRF